MKKFLIWFLWFLGGCGNTAFAQYNRAAQAANITSNVYQNTTHAITGTILQGVMLNQNNSYVNLLSDTNLLDLRNFSTSGTYTPGMAVFHLGGLYMDIATQHGVWNPSNFTAVAVPGTAWSLTGNALAGTEVLGSTNGHNLKFITNNTFSGLINYAAPFSTFFGYNCGSGSTGNNNTGFGYTALQNNGTGSSNTAVGENAMVNNSSGGSNTAFGYGALNSNTTGAENTSVGSGSSPIQINLRNTTSLGYGATPTASNEIIFGNGFITQLTAGTVCSPTHAADILQLDDTNNADNIIPGMAYMKSYAGEQVNGGTITLSGAVSGSGNVNTTITTSYSGNLPLANLNSGTNAATNTFWSGVGTNGTWIQMFKVASINVSMLSTGVDISALHYRNLTVYITVVSGNIGLITFPTSPSDGDIVTLVTSTATAFSAGPASYSPSPTTVHVEATPTSGSIQVYQWVAGVMGAWNQIE